MADGKDSSSSVRDKLKNIFSGNSSKQNDEEVDEKLLQDLFPDDFWSCISNKSETQSNNRISKLNSVEKIIVTQVVPKSCLKRLWIESNDLLDLSSSEAIRHSYMSFLVTLIKAQYRNLGMLKLMFYNTLIEKRFTGKDDVLHIMLVIDAITEQGKSIGYLEQDVSPQLV